MQTALDENYPISYPNEKIKEERGVHVVHGSTVILTSFRTLKSHYRHVGPS